MRVECAWCKKDLGEKCPNCGSENYLFAESDQSHVECLDCGQIYVLGAGNVSSSICEECRPKEFPRLPGRLRSEDIVARAARRGSR